MLTLGHLVGQLKHQQCCPSSFLWVSPLPQVESPAWRNAGI